MQKPMATSRESETLPLARSSTGQDSNSNLHSESSAARCCVFQGHKLKQLKNRKLRKGQAKSECMQVRYSVSYKFSAGRSVSAVSVQTNNPDSQTGLATRVYGRNAVSYLHYLQRQIKLIISKVNSHHHKLESTIKLVHRKIDSYTEKLKNRVETMRYGSFEDDELDKGLIKLNAKRVAFTEDLNRRMDLLLAKNTSYYQDIRIDVNLLNSKIGPFAQEVDVQRKLLDIKVASYTQSVNVKISDLRYFHSEFTDDFSEEFTGAHI